MPIQGAILWRSEAQVGGAGGEDQGKFGGSPMELRFGRFGFDADRRLLTRDDAPVHITHKAFDLLELLLRTTPRVLRKSELHERLWPGTFVSDATLVGLVKELRRAFDDHDRAAPVIRTVHGVGYAFSAAINRPLRPSRTSRWIVIGAQRFCLGDGDYVIGRDPASAIWLDVPGVSRRHARVVVADQITTVEDLGSKNGTLLGEVRVTSPAPLHDGDRITVGPVPLVFHASGTTVSTETLRDTIGTRSR